MVVLHRVDSIGQGKKCLGTGSFTLTGGGESEPPRPSELMSTEPLLTELSLRGNGEMITITLPQYDLTK